MTTLANCRCSSGSISARKSSDRPLRGPLSLLFQTVFHWPWFARYMNITALNHGWPSVNSQPFVLPEADARSRRRRRASRESAGS